jgi:hypothetical protein
MPIDFKKLTDQELDALEAGDFTKLSDATLEQIEKDAAEEDRAKRTAQTPTSAFSMARPDVYGASFQPPTETLERGATAAVRYGAPIAAGIATGGVGLIPALVTGAAGGMGETIAQLMEIGRGEREELSGRSIAASTVAAGAPVFQAAGAPV